MIGRSLLDVAPSDVPSNGTGIAKNLSVDGFELRPLIVGPIGVKGVVSQSELDSESLSGSYGIILGVNLIGDVRLGMDSYWFRKGGSCGIGVSVQIIGHPLYPLGKGTRTWPSGPVHNNQGRPLARWTSVVLGCTTYAGGLSMGCCSSKRGWSQCMMVG